MNRDAIEVIDRMENIVRDRLSDDDTTTEVVLWDDGDYQVEVFHTVSAYDAVTFREALFYDSEEGTIKYREYMLCSDEKRYTVRVHDLEGYE